MNTTKLILCFSVALLTSTITVAASSNIYKWTDKDGTVHYSQNAPQGQTAEVITTKTPRAPLPEVTPSATTTDTTTTPPETNAATTGNQANTEGLAKKDQATCDKATKAAQDLQKPIIMRDGKIMSIEDKNSEITRMQEIIKVHCP